MSEQDWQDIDEIFDKKCLTRFTNNASCPTLAELLCEVFFTTPDDPWDASSKQVLAMLEERVPVLAHANDSAAGVLMNRDELVGVPTVDLNATSAGHLLFGGDSLLDFEWLDRLRRLLRRFGADVLVGLFVEPGSLEERQIQMLREQGFFIAETFDRDELLRTSEYKPLPYPFTWNNATGFSGADLRLDLDIDKVLCPTVESWQFMKNSTLVIDAFDGTLDDRYLILLLGEVKHRLSASDTHLTEEKQWDDFGFHQVTRMDKARDFALFVGVVNILIGIMTNGRRQQCRNQTLKWILRDLI